MVNFKFAGYDFAFVSLKVDKVIRVYLFYLISDICDDSVYISLCHSFLFRNFENLVCYLSTYFG